MFKRSKCKLVFRGDFVGGGHRVVFEKIGILLKIMKVGKLDVFSL